MGVASCLGIMKCWGSSSRGWLSFKAFADAEAAKGRRMEWETHHMNDCITSLQNDLLYFLDSITQEIYQELLWGAGGGVEEGIQAHYVCTSVIKCEKYIFVSETMK